MVNHISAASGKEYESAPVGFGIRRTTTPHRPGASELAALPDSGSPTRDIEPGDAVPPGVAPADPEPADGEAEIGRENLEAHLRGE